MKVNDFLDKVYQWLVEPRNRDIEDWHYHWAETLDEQDFTQKIREFLEQRYIQMFNRKADSRFIIYATKQYIEEMFS